MPDNLIEHIDKFKLPIALSILGLVLIIGGVVTSGVGKTRSKEYPKESLVQPQESIFVDVSGAVSTPGVYKLNDGDRIEEAIKAAGGFSDGTTVGKANQEYISKNLNMAQKLSDGTKIYVPFEGEQVSGGRSNGGLVGAPVVAGVSIASKININTASQSELEALSGVGPVTASKIISSRPYQRIEDLLTKKILGKAVFEKIKVQLVVY